MNFRQKVALLRICGSRYVLVNSSRCVVQLSKQSALNEMLFGGLSLWSSRFLSSRLGADNAPIDQRGTASENAVNFADRCALQI